MVSRFDELNKLFEEIDSSINERVRFFVIGGAMLLYHGIKDATKDIDIVVDTEKEFLLLQTTLEKLKFAGKAPTFEYQKVDLSQIFVRKDFRIDLFHKIVCKGFQLSNAMKKRAQKVEELKRLTIFLCSHEDVLLFKTFTEREGDIADCLAIAQAKEINWIAVLEELKSQIRASGNKIWVTWVGERFDVLEERGLIIPIMNEVDKLRDEYFEEYDKHH